MIWQAKRIGDFLTESNIESASPSADRRIRVRLNAGGVEKRPLLSETEGATRYFRRSAGQFIYGKQNLHKGAFGIIPSELDGFESSSDLPAFDVADGLRPKWLEYFLKQGNFYQTLVSISRGAATKRIQPSALFQIEIPIPSLAEQDEIIARMDLCGIEHAKLEHEAAHQKLLLSRLKQAILQEAIQGKLTADWRAAHQNVEPASQLLRRIQAEKIRLVAAKKLRPEKPLPKITPDKIPFEIPNEWELCRTSDIGVVIGGLTKNSARRSGHKRLLPYLRVANVYADHLNLTDLQEIGVADSEVEKLLLEKDDLLVVEGNGSRDQVGRIARWDGSVDPCVHQNHIIKIRLGEKKVALWALYWFLSPSGRMLIEEQAKTSTGLYNLSSGKVANLPILLPPLAEQEAIVEKVEALMATCRALEAEIEHSRTHAANLLQTVLREAFSGKLVAQDENDKPAPATAKVIPFPARNLTRIANISPTDLQAGIIAMAYQRHEQTPKYLQHFHHVKAEKIVHLVEAHLGIDLERMPVKAAAGPNDYPHLKKVESRARKASWFDVRQAKTGGTHTYYKKSSFDVLLDKTAAALGERAAEVDALINLLLPMDTRQAEIVATLYAAWNNLLLLGRSPSDEDIVYEARENWHTSKLEIERERFFNALEWMRKQGLVPVGRGRYVDAK